MGEPAPDFELPSIQGENVRLSDLRARYRVVLWFSRGFTCNFCRNYMDSVIRPYARLKEQDIEVLQLAPNLYETARRYFQSPPPYPFLCDPDKRLYAVYGLGDRGVLDAMGNTLVSFGHAVTHGEGSETLRAAWTELANRNFVSRLNHHALTAMDQAIIVVDTEGLVRFRQIYRPLEAIPDGEALIDLVNENC